TLSISAADLFLYPYLLFVLIEKHARHEGFHRPVGWLPALLYLMWMLLSALVADNTPGGMLAAFLLLKSVLVYVVLADQLTTPRRFNAVMIAFTAGLLIQLPIIASQWLSGTGLQVAGARSAAVGMRVTVGDASAFRPPGLMRHPNELADYPLFLLPTALLIILAGARLTNWKIRAAAWIVLITSAGVLIISLSRGAWIAGAAAFVALVVVGRRRGIVRQRHITQMVALGGVAVLAVMIVYPAAIDRITSDDQRSTQVRLAMFEQALMMIRAHPIAGIGLGGYFDAATQYVPTSFGNFSPALREGITGNVVHNKYLLILAEHGVIGLLIVLATYWSFFSRWLRTHVWSDPGRMIVALGLTMSLAAQLVFYLFEHFYFGFRTDALWLTFGLLAALYRMEARARPEIA
ncbi:MAG: O-antigen ligase family protein, partial [Phycisphaerae bacterium]|nr:O-antigen ligase family protein [Gemmatimonadaceae bacterium]